MGTSASYASVIACTPFAGQLLAEASVASPAAIAGVVYLGVVPTALAFSTWGYALTRMPAGQLGVLTYVVPPLTVVAGWAIFSEVPGFLAIIGGALCLVGVALSRRRSPAPQADAEAAPRHEAAAPAPVTGSSASEDVSE